MVYEVHLLLDELSPGSLLSICSPRPIFVMIFEESEKVGRKKKQHYYMTFGVTIHFDTQLRNAAVLLSLSSSISLPTTYLMGGNTRYFGKVVILLF